MLGSSVYHGSDQGKRTCVRPNVRAALRRSPVERVLERLEDVRQVGEGRWMARCPAHPDRRPSLSIAEGADGRALVHCFSGCRSQEIVAAIGLTLRDLFPHDAAPDYSRRLCGRPGPSEMEIWTQFTGLRRGLRVELAAMIRKTELAARQAGPGLFDDDELAARVGRLGLWEFLFDALLGEGSPDEQLWALVLAAEEVRRHGQR